MLAKQEKITRLHGDINYPYTVVILKEEIGKIAATIKLYHNDKGDVWGHLSIIIPKDKMGALIGDVGFDGAAPV